MGAYFKNYISKKEYLSVLFLIFASGNPLVSEYITEYIYVIGAFISIIFTFNTRSKIRIRRNIQEYKNLGKYLLICLFIFLCQFLIFGWNTFPGIVNFICKIIFGASIVIYMGYKFKFAYLHLMTLISIVSIIGWLIQISANQDFGLIPLRFGHSSIFFNTIIFHPLRNCGCFWEPGAYACYLLFIPILFSNEMYLLWTKYRKQSAILLIALFTTQSTTGYMAFFIFSAIYYLTLTKQSFWKYLIIIPMVGIYVYVYNNTEFLSKKIEGQAQSAINAQGKYNSTRMGSILFDLHYIKKHPIVGNGLHERTRYIDHPYLLQEWRRGLAMSGNGFSGRLAEMGFLFYAAFIYFYFKTNKQCNKKKIWLSLFFILLILQGEQLFNYPLLSTLPFVKLFSNVTKSRNLYIMKNKHI